MKKRSGVVIRKLARIWGCILFALVLSQCGEKSILPPPPVVSADSIAFVLEDFDSLMYVANDGFSRLDFNLNGLRIELTGDSSRLSRVNTFYLGKKDSLVFNIVNYLNPGAQTTVWAWRYGSREDSAFLWWGNVLPPQADSLEILLLP